MAKILVIDDEPEMLDLIRIILEGAGHRVATCDTGRRAWEAIVETRPDLLVLDVMLPGVDGYSLQTKMAQEKATQNIPILILTALEPAKTLFEKAGNVAGFLAKPFRSEDLLSKVKATLGAEVTKGDVA
ncbi:MAG: response regulator [Elusimicrobia bacterium]|nr:response regulator [Elusimicrobiota bacterium]